MKKNKYYNLPDFLCVEIIYLEKRLDNSLKKYETVKKDLPKNHSLIDAIGLIDFGLDVVQVYHNHNKK